MNKKIQIIAAVVITITALSVGYFFFGGSNTAVIVRLITTNPPVEGGIMLQNEQRSMEPDTLIFTVGVPVTLVFVNNDDIESHQFSIPELNIQTESIAPFESTSIEFTPTKAGTFVFRDVRPEETYTYVDFRGETINQLVDHSVERGVVIVKP